MAASSEPRRRRYERRIPQRPITLTTGRIRLLRFVADIGLITLPQLARVSSLPPRAVRRQMRYLFDAGLVDLHPVGRCALADPSLPNDQTLLFGSAPNLYSLSDAGARTLREVGDEQATAPNSRFGPRNTQFLLHLVQLHDVRIWLMRTGSVHRKLELWHEGKDAWFDLQRSRPPLRCCPDAWFIYRLNGRVLVGLVEVDRGTEKGGLRWKQKLDSYQILFTGDRIKEKTGYAHARVLVLTPDARRRASLAQFIAKEAPAGLAARFWLAERSVLQRPDLGAALWQRPGNPELLPLLPPELLLGAEGAPGT